MALKKMGTVIALTATVSSTAAPVVFLRTLTLPERLSTPLNPTVATSPEALRA